MRGKRRLLGFFVLLICEAAFGPRATAGEKLVTFENPLKQNGADPWLFLHDGWYYLSTTTVTDVRLRRSRLLGDLPHAEDVVVWNPMVDGRCQDIWASEFHRLESGDGLRWYIYYTASAGPEPSHRMYVAESIGDDPNGPYRFKAQLQTDPDDLHYAIDGTVYKAKDGTLYFLWCGRPSRVGQGLYISRMSNPWTLFGPRVYLPAAGFGCDVVREAPALIRRGGRVFLVYSMCGADTPDYRLGMLSAEVGANLLAPDVWMQHPKPVFTRADGRGVYGPGHCCFFQSPDGTEDWIAYHAKSSTEITYADRSTRVQRFDWTPDGLPNFGRPVSLDADIPVPSSDGLAKRHRVLRSH